MKTPSAKHPAAPTTQAADDAARYASIKLGIDAHKDDYRVVRMVDGMRPQPAQRFRSVEALLDFVAAQVRQAREVHTCYEAGPLGYSLHRRLLALGARNIVVVPVCLDEAGKRVKTDSRDALALCVKLDRHATGNTSVFSVVSVPTEEQERARTAGRERTELVRTRTGAVAHVRSTFLYYGVNIDPAWWRNRPGRDALLARYPEHLREVARNWLAMIDAISEKILELDARLKDEAPPRLPRYMGTLTAALIEREVRDWSNFRNRRQIASFTGLCPSVDSSGARRFQGPVNKHGNPRLRTLLVELAWRIIRHQPASRVMRKWGPRLRNAPKGRRKQIAVAVAREFCVDWWRIRTGRCTAGDLGYDLGALFDADSHDDTGCESGPDCAD